MKPFCIWFTGLSGAGKSTIASALVAGLEWTTRTRVALLDGDALRRGLNSDLGFEPADRVENIRRIREVARLMYNAGVSPVVAAISPFASERGLARELFPTGRFIEVYVATPLAVCEQRDPKGLYARARAGHLISFTGIDSPYEAPSAPEVRIKANTAIDVAVETILDRVRSQMKGSN